MKMTCFTALKFNPQCDIRPLLSTPSRLLSQFLKSRYVYRGVVLPPISLTINNLPFTFQFGGSPLFFKICAHIYRIFKGLRPRVWSFSRDLTN